MLYSEPGLLRSHDQHFQCLDNVLRFGMFSVAALQAVQSFANLLWCESLSAFCDLRRQSLEDSSHFRILAATALEAVQSIANILCTEGL